MQLTDLCTGLVLALVIMAASATSSHAFKSQSRHGMPLASGPAPGRIMPAVQPKRIKPVQPRNQATCLNRRCRDIRPVAGRAQPGSKSSKGTAPRQPDGDKPKAAGDTAKSAPTVVDAVSRAASDAKAAKDAAAAKAAADAAALQSAADSVLAKIAADAAAAKNAAGDAGKKAAHDAGNAAKDAASDAGQTAKDTADAAGNAPKDVLTATADAVVSDVQSGNVQSVAPDAASAAASAACHAFNRC